MMMLQYSTPLQSSTTFQSCLGASGKARAVAAGSMLSPSPGSCMLAPSEKSHLPAPFSTAAGWCAGAEQPGAAANVGSKVGDALVSLRELHIPSCGVDACGKERDCRPPDQSTWGTMYHPGGAPPPPGTPPQPLQQHKSPADVGGSSVHMGRLVNTRARHASAATALPGLAPAGTMTQGSTHESGVKQFSGPYNRTSHPPHDVHSRKRRQGVNSNGGGDAESESAVSGGHAAGDQSVRMHAQVRQPRKHPRGGSTRFDSLGDRREVRGREAKERQGGPAGAVGLPAPEPTCAESFTGWARQDVSCQPQSSPPPPPDDSSAAPQHTSTDSSCRQVMLPSSSSTNSQTSAERSGGGRSWRGLSPGSGAPPPPPPHAMKAVLRACYSDQILDNSRGLPCFKRLKAAFVSVAEVAGHPDLIVPRYLNLARRVPHLPLHRSRPHQSAPLPPPAAPGCAAPAGAAVEDRRGCPAPQGEHTGTPSRDAHGAVTTAANGHGSSNGRSGAGAATVVGGWRAQGVAGGRSCTSAESLSPHPPPSVADTKQPPWLSRNADPGRQQMIQEEMSEVSSVDSDDDEMEDGEVAEEAARVETHQQQHVDVRDSRVFRTDTTPSGDTSTPTMPARIPPWVSTPGAGVAHALRPSAQQQQSHAAVFDSRSDGPPHAEQQSVSVPDSREGHQQESEEASPFQCGPPVASFGGSTLLKRPKPYLSETAGAGPCAADGGLPSGCPSVRHFPCAGELKSEQVPPRTANVADSLENKPYPGPCAIESAAAGASGLQHERSSSSCPPTAQQPEALTEATLSQPSATSHLDVPSSRKCAGGHTANHVMQPSVEGAKFQVAAGGSSSSHQDSCPGPKTYVAAGSSSEGAVAKPRPMDPRLTRQPKLQTAQHGRSSSGGISQDVRNATVSGAADNVDANASSVGKVESFIERKILPDSVAASVQPGTTSTVTSSCSRSSSGSKTDSASAASTETRADPSRYYVCSIDGSRVELKPPQAPAAGTLPESLAGTCIARGKLPLLLDLDNTLLHAQAAAVTGCDVRLQDWLDENGEPELFRFELSCNRKSYYMKLRPYLRTFLRVLEPYYEMSVYTNATQEYADIVVAILDENRQLFSDRIVARNSGFRGEASENKAVRRMYENMDKRCIVAFDDRQNIWTDLPLSHVVKAQHYDFFDSHRAELNAYYPPLPTIGSSGCGLQGADALGRMSDEVGIGGELALPDENQQQQGKLQQGKSDQQMLKSSTSGRKPCDWDKHLDCMLKLFLHIHTEFFRDPLNANIGAILSSVQQGVLSGVGIFFTGYRKTYSPGAAVADCEERQAELAQRLGAKVYKRFDEEGVTHVVAGKNNTNNMLACRENTKLSRVHTLWLYCCEAALTRVPETAFEADALCAYYENSPPTSPYRDHWIHLAQKDDSTKEEKVGASSSKTEIPTSTDTGASWLSAAHQHHPLPPQDSLPVREFLGTGPYSDGATLTSPYEEIVFIWRPDKQTVRQLYGEDTRGAAAPSATGTLNTGAPFGSLSPNTGVLLAPVKRGLAGGTSNTLSGTNPLGPTDTRTGFFGESPVEASVFTPSLHAAHDEGLLETKRVGVLAHGTCSQMQLGLPYE